MTTAEVKELRQLLSEASVSDDADAIGRVATSLRAVSKNISTHLDESLRQDWQTFHTSLERFETHGKKDKAKVLAHGLRLCRTLVGAAETSLAPEDYKEVLALPGVGAKTLAKLVDAGFETVRDIALHLPRHYLDARSPLPISQLSPGMGLVVASGRVSQSKFIRSRRMRWIDAHVADPMDRAAVLRIRWFNAYPTMMSTFEVGNELTLAATLRDPDQLSVANPQILGKGKDSELGIISVYRDVPGIGRATMAKICRAASLCHCDELMSQQDASTMDLPTLSESLQVLHIPGNPSEEEMTQLNDKTSPWHRRLALELALPVSVGVELRRRRCRQLEAPACPALGAGEINELFPFELTDAQRRAVKTISANISDGSAMNRLLQGDVGSGKTAVAFAAAAQAAGAGHQVAIMAPTEVLAEQHFSSLRQLPGAANMNLALLTASMAGATKKSTTARLASGDIDVIVGTHALLSRSVQFASLGLVVIDEQHRFGTAQRGRLRTQAAGKRPHMLVMTATPIPRTLALTLYGDLDVTTMDELPAGRKPIKTAIAKGKQRIEKVRKTLESAAAGKDPAFVVCPIIEPSEARAQWVSVEKMKRWIEETFGSDVMSVCHGRMSYGQRQEAMADFRNGATNILVATTVIEVGVDIPSATSMIIMDADRFGLAQLHQLRGRVGRGQRKSRCLLVASKYPTPDGMARLQALASHSDGFVLAESDLEMRGPGELMGIRQAGLPRLPFGSMQQYLETVEFSRRCAEFIVDADPTLDSHPKLAAEIERSVWAFGQDTG